MTSNPEAIVQHVQDEFQNLLAYVTGPDARAQTVYRVESTFFRRLLALGAALLRLFFVTRAAVRPAEPVTAPDGTRLIYPDRRPTTDYSLFANVRFGRHAFTAPGQEGVCPLDAELSLPAHGYADLLREWAVYGATDESYRESQTVLERILGVSLSLQALETGVIEAGQDVMTLYEQPAAPTTPPSVGPILVMQADGKGVPMVQPPPQTPSMRLGKGQKRGKKKEAVVTGLYTMAPYPRTPQDVAAALLQEPGRLEPAARPPPVGKDLRATPAGKADAMRRLAERVAQRDGPHNQPHVALTDGAEALPQQVVTHVPASTLILDVIHATAYLWDTANALLGETHPHRTMWVRAYLEPLLTGQTEAVITALAAEATAPTGTATPRQAVRRTVGYYRRNQPYMRSDEYLAQGWPIGTGVVEGACRHVVKDRLEPSGMRWTNTGAQAVLDLRAVRRNGQWEAYGQFHRHQQHRRLSGMSAQVPEKAEAQALTLAASSNCYPRILVTLKRFLKEREGRAASGQQILPRSDRILYDEAADDLRRYYRTTKTRNLEEAEYRFKNLNPFFRGMKVKNIGPSEVTDYIEKRQDEGAADKTINNELEVLVKVLRLAYENGKLLRIPVIHKLKVNNVRKGFFEPEMFERVRKLLPEDYQLAITIAYTYGWRMQSEILTLEWRQVDIHPQAGTLRLDPGSTKNDDGRVVYMTPELNVLLIRQLERVQALERAMGRIIPYVFPHLKGLLQGERLQDFKKAWKAACVQADCPGMLRHDHRRTVVRNMVNLGIRERVAMEVTGHKTRSVFDRDDIVNKADHREVAKKLTGVVSGLVAEIPASS